MPRGAAGAGALTAGWERATARARGEVREGLPLLDLLGALPERERAGLRRLALVVLRPDSVAAAQGPAILADLEDRHGALPVAVRVLDVAPALVDALYARQERIPRESLWLHHEVFATGPAAAVLVACADPPAAGLCETLYGGKGPSAPVAPEPGDSLRARFGRASSFHAVVHIPEDLAAFVAEATLLFPWARLRELAAQRAPSPLAPGAVRELVALEPRAGRSVFQAVVKVKRRIAAALAVRGVAPAGMQEALDDVDRDLDGAGYLRQRDRFIAFAREERPILLAAMRRPAGRHAAPQPAGATVQQAWRAREAAAAPAALLQATWLLSGHEPCGVEDAARVLRTLPAYDVPLIPAQRTLLAAALRADLNPSAARDGARVFPLDP